MNELKDTLESLLRLQDAETALAAVDEELRRIPARIAEIEGTLAGAEQALVAVRTSLQDGSKERRSLEKDIEAVKAVISRHQDQLMQVKTNDQYRAMTKEIAGEKSKIEAIEEKILLGMERADELNREVKAKEAELAGEKERVAREKAVLGEERKRLEGERAALAAEQASLLLKPKAEALALYRRILQMRGSAISRVKVETCGECRVRARPQALAEARAKERLVQCENCHRILYVEPLPPAPAGESVPATEADADTDA